MTDDIVARLRVLADCDARSGEPLGKCMRKAADEIERLRAHLKVAVWSDSEECKFLTSEIARKDAALEQITRECGRLNKGPIAVEFARAALAPAQEKKDDRP